MNDKDLQIVEDKSIQDTINPQQISKTDVVNMIIDEKKMLIDEKVDHWSILIDQKQKEINDYIKLNNLKANKLGVTAEEVEDYFLEHHADLHQIFTQMYSKDISPSFKLMHFFCLYTRERELEDFVGVLAEEVFSGNYFIREEARKEFGPEIKDEDEYEQENEYSHNESLMHDPYYEHSPMDMFLRDDYFNTFHITRGIKFEDLYFNCAVVIFNGHCLMNNTIFKLEFNKLDPNSPLYKRFEKYFKLQEEIEEYRNMLQKVVSIKNKFNNDYDMIKSQITKQLLLQSDSGLEIIEKVKLMRDKIDFGIDQETQILLDK